MNHYEILGVGPHATEQQIKEAYRREAMKWHPDRHDGAAAKGEADRRFKDLAVAYRTLRNPVDRANYDRQLEQKLRQEYEARQQKAQNERTQQKQTRQEPPQPDFADTGPQFEEQTASNDDANQMFYEQMLDLASELAGRGFPEFNIFKALVALGCPETMARNVAKLAANNGHDATNAGVGNKREEPAISNFDKASFEEMEPYYAASIMGVEPITPISETRFQEILDLRKRRSRFWLALGVVILLIGLVASLVKKWGLAEAFLIALAIDAVLVIFWILSRSLFLGPDKKQFYAEEKKRYYLDAFRALHFEKVGGMKPQKTEQSRFNNAAFFASFGWLGYRRLPVPSFVGAAMVSALIYAMEFVESSTGKATGGALGIGVGVAFGTMANQLYFNRVRSNILDAIEGTTKNQALIRLRKKGGTNSFGWILPLVFYFLLFIPLGIIEDEKAAEKDRIVREQQAAQSIADKAANEARQRAAAAQRDQTDLDKAIVGLEARFPQLNPKSPQYTQQDVDWVLERMKSYVQSGGRSSADSLNQAVIDYAAALQTQPTVQPQQPRTQDSVSFFGGVGKRVSLNFQNIDIRALLQVFTDTSGLRFIAADQVSGGVNIRVADLPWNEALMQMLQQNQLAIIKVRTGYYVFPSTVSDEVAFRSATQKGF